MCLAIRASHCSSVSAGYIPGTQTLHRQWKKIYRLQDAFQSSYMSFPWKRACFFLYIKSSSKQVTFYHCTSIRADTAFVWAEKREGLHSHMDATTPWDSCVRHPASAYGWISLKHLYPSHYICVRLHLVQRGLDWVGILVSKQLKSQMLILLEANMDISVKRMVCKPVKVNIYLWQ